jgi:uncharacterized protein (DUF302 family)
MIKHLILLFSLLVYSAYALASPFAAVVASDLIMARSKQDFPEAMLTLQQSVSDHGYKVARVQRIDIGLTGMGYNTDKYSVVFVGKTEEIQYLVDKYPQLASYMPPVVAIFAEEGDTVVVTAHPFVYADMIEDKEDKLIFERWESDIYSVFNDFSTAED